MRQLSCQSSIEPCVPEESPEQEEKEIFESTIDNTPTTPTLTTSPNRSNNNNSNQKFSSPGRIIRQQSSPKSSPRPDTLLLLNDNNNSKQPQKKFLYRSNSTRTYQKPKAKLKLDQIYFIGNNQTDDDNYNSIDVIDERRRKNFTRITVPSSCSDSNNDDGNNQEGKVEVVEHKLEETECISLAESIMNLVQRNNCEIISDSIILSSTQVENMKIDDENDKENQDVLKKEKNDEEDDEVVSDKNVIQILN